jgi:hypothetical protein
MKNKYSFLSEFESLTLKEKTFRAAASIIIFFFGLGLSSQAQDLIKLNSGKELKVNIVEENENTVKYREYENPTGPLYSVTKDKVASIKYKKGQPPKAEKTENAAPATAVPELQSGSAQQLTVKKRYVMLNGKTQSSKAVKSMMEDNPEALRFYESGRRLLRASNGCLYGSIFTALIANIAINNAEDDDASQKAAIAGLSVAGGFFIAAIITVSAGKSKVRKSVELYNSSLNKPVSYKLDIGLQDNGIGLALRF